MIAHLEARVIRVSTEKTVECIPQASNIAQARNSNWKLYEHQIPTKTWTMTRVINRMAIKTVLKMTMECTNNRLNSIKKMGRTMKGSHKQSGYMKMLMGTTTKRKKKRRKKKRNKQMITYQTITDIFTLINLKLPPINTQIKI